MGASLDLRKAHLTRQHGDIMAIYTWVNDERALILIPHRRPGSPWYIVMESAAFKYDNPEYLARQGKVACDILGIEPSTANWYKIACIINEGIPDLVRMPSSPEPEYIKAALGSMLLKADGKPIAGEDIQVRDEGVRYG